MTQPAAPDQNADNIRAIFLMVGSMALFALEDTLIKLAAREIGIGQILLILGVVGGLFASLMSYRQRAGVSRADLFHPVLMIRASSEVLGTYGFVTALSLIPLSTASAILQATPLVVTLGAALFLREAVGWRRWTAVLIGFVGVMLIIRPGFDGFDANSLYAVLGVIGLAARDVVTRRIPKSIPTSIVAAQAFWAVAVLGLVLMLVSGDIWLSMSPLTIGLMAAASSCGIIAYFTITAALRLGEISAIAPFRYARLIFALIVGYLVFREVPDVWMISGSVLIVAGGLYALYRERVRQRQPGL